MASSGTQHFTLFLRNKKELGTCDEDALKMGEKNILLALNDLDDDVMAQMTSFLRSSNDEMFYVFLEGWNA